MSVVGQARYSSGPSPTSAGTSSDNTHAGRLRST